MRKKKKLNHHNIINPSPATIESNNEKSHRLIWRYGSPKGEELITLLSKSFEINLPENILTKSTFSVNRLRGTFVIEMQSKKIHQHVIC